METVPDVSRKMIRRFAALSKWALVYALLLGLLPLVMSAVLYYLHNKPGDSMQFESSLLNGILCAWITLCISVVPLVIYLSNEMILLSKRIHELENNPKG